MKATCFRSTLHESISEHQPSCLDSVETASEVGVAGIIVNGAAAEVGATAAGADRADEDEGEAEDADEDVVGALTTTTTITITITVKVKVTITTW